VERAKFVAEGKLEMGPAEHYFTFLESEHLGWLLLEHFGAPEERGIRNLDRARITVEPLDDQADF
jgi:hypothetical protein